MLIISESWHASDLGRQRQGNEDNFFVRAPLFAVADGMGGARAGEVASEMAVATFEGGLPSDGTPAEGLVRIIEEANRRIHDRSRAEADQAGMGTTVTAAHVGESVVTVAHVGDSRAYVLRDGELIRLTRDHSLVGELVARGKLTEEQAEAHPQRSVITRALGPEPSVQVDVETFHGRSGDVFLLCSDGLTSMVPEPQLKSILSGAPRLAQAGRELIVAANDAGGRDNITVVLFRLEEVEARGKAASDRSAEEGKTAEYEAWEGDGPAASDTQEAEYRRSGTVALSPVRPRTHAREVPAAVPAGDGSSPRRPPRRRRRVRPALIVAAVGLALVIGGFWAATRMVYFVGVDAAHGNAITIYQGLPYELPFGVDLYRRYAGSGTTLAEVPRARRASFTDHKLRPLDDAENLVNDLETGRLEP
jgi:PPM family protein phosphatase